MEKSADTSPILYNRELEELQAERDRLAALTVAQAVEILTLRRRAMDLEYARGKAEDERESQSKKLGEEMAALERRSADEARAFKNKAVEMELEMGSLRGALRDIKTKLATLTGVKE